MAQVTCKYCKKKFDRAKEAYIQIPTGSTFRYAHAHCYTEQKNKGLEKGTFDIWTPEDSTTCFWCHKAINKHDKDVEQFKYMPERYIHIKCGETHPADDKEKLFLYVIQLYQPTDIARFSVQIEQFRKNYNFTYSGMTKALKYWYEVKKKPIDKSKGLGIIPYIYQQARDYYYALWLAQQANDKIDIKAYLPKDVEIKIKSPKRDIVKKKMFSFLDGDDYGE